MLQLNQHDDDIEQSRHDDISDASLDDCVASGSGNFLHAWRSDLPLIFSLRAFSQ